MAGNNWRSPWKAFLPHEWIFGAFLLITSARLFLCGGAAANWAAVFLGCALVGAGIVFWAEQNPTPWRWRVRLLFYPAAMGISFYSMGPALPFLGIPATDGILMQWDRALIGETPSITWQPWLRPWLEDVAMVDYLFFFYYLVAGPGYYCIRNVRLFRKCIVGLFTMYGFAFMGYAVFPAGGPHRWLSFTTPLHGPLLVDLTLNPVNGGSISMDAFPSVHIAASTYLLLFDWEHRRRRFWWILTPCLMLWFSTMYLRFHYFVDLLAGVAVALIGWWMAQQYDAATANEPMMAPENSKPASCHPPRAGLPRPAAKSSPPIPLANAMMPSMDNPEE